jgi:P pilus assembly chaperone PapD
MMLLPLPIRSALRRAALVVAALVLLAPAARAVTVSPTALYLGARNPSALLTLINTGTLPEEIELSFGFGYPTSDSSGVLRVDIVDSAGATEPSVAGWLRAFPRRLVLQPGQRQVVRVTVVAPASLADGEYWGRVLVKSRGGEPPIEQTQGQVRMQLSLETTFATAVFYHKGDVRTGISIPTASAERTKDGVLLTMDLKREGNAAFLGRVHADLVDASGATIGSAEDVAAVYRQLRRRFLIKTVAPLPAGPLTVRYVVDTDRPDLPPVGPLRAPAVNGYTAVR